jgi:hypothetical protein
MKVKDTALSILLMLFAALLGTQVISAEEISGSDKILSVSPSSPITVKPGDTVSVKVKYSATESRDISIHLQQNKKPWEWYSTETREPVNAGSGEVTHDLKILADIPLDGSAGSLPYGQWRIISLPKTPPSPANTVKAIFGDDMGEKGDYGTNLVVYGFNTNTNTYGEPLALTDKMKVGRGYWLIQKIEEGRSVTLKMPEGSTETPATQSIPLSASNNGSVQWNLAGNPFSSNLNLGDLKVATNAPNCDQCNLDEASDNDLLRNQVWTYDGQGYIKKSRTDSIEPWSGFWAAALGGATGHSIELSKGGSNGDDIIPSDNRIEWTPGIPGGIPDTSSWDDDKISVTDFDGVDPTGRNNSLGAIQKVIDKAPPNSIINFPEGEYKIEGTLVLNKSNIVLRGANNSTTKINCYVPESLKEPCIKIIGNSYGKGFKELSTDAGYQKGSLSLTVPDAIKFKVGEFAEIQQTNDMSKMTSPNWPKSKYGNQSWTKNLLGQLFEIKEVQGDRVTFKTPLHISYSEEFKPKIRRVNLVKNVGIENLSFEVKSSRLKSDNSFATILMKYSTYSWVKNINSENTGGQHVRLAWSLGCEVKNSEFSLSHLYLGGGNGYGVSLAHHTTDSLVENNYFSSLRHAMVLSAGANGNVVAYNYSKETKQREDEKKEYYSWGPDISMHGTYAYMNLIEGNSVETLMIADYWGPTGPGNTYFRNLIRDEYGVNDNKYSRVYRLSTIKQNLIGNSLSEISGTYDEEPGDKRGIYDNLEHGNIVGGEAVWDENTANHSLVNSYYLKAKPSFFGDKWPLYGPSIGFPREQLPAQRLGQQ